MSRVRYTKSLRDLDQSRESDDDALNGPMRSIRVVYETDAEVARAVVPKPLEAGLGAEVHVSFTVVDMHVSPDVTIELRSASFGVRVEYDDKPGIYFLTTPMTSERAVVMGRERFGAPAKSAQIDFDLTNESVSASVERMGIPYLGARGTRVEELAPRTTTEYGYCFKAFPSCLDGKGFDQDPQLVRLDWQYDFARVWRVEGELVLRDSPFDPVVDFPVRRIAAFEYTEGRALRSARILRPVPGDWLLPFLHQKFDDPGVEGIEA